ncbi:gap junction alpha-4 protein [Pelmatolapia mariae]|uniref:gap junction alpha-4 protein n=1 Tax=Pelmatolapia mariae TaxID=158779 RepID=UPI002FE6BEE1
MAAIVTGLIPILRTAVDATATYKCRSLWFGLLCVRLVVLFFAELPFSKLDADFTCNSSSPGSSTPDVCTKFCFNERFDKPMIVAWNFIFIIFVITVLLMELFTSHLRTMAQKRSFRTKADEKPEAQGTEEAQMVAMAGGRGKMIIDLHKDRGTVGFYLLSIVLRILVEACFLFLLLYWNLHALRDEHMCTKEGCKYVCILRAAPEKRMSIYALASISGIIIACSVLFCVYSIVHYLCNA